jgi:hypothetical protein
VTVNKVLGFVLRAINPLNPLRLETRGFVLVGASAGVLIFVFDVLYEHFVGTRSYLTSVVIGGCAAAIVYFVSGCIAEWKNGRPS